MVIVLLLKLLFELLKCNVCDISLLCQFEPRFLFLVVTNCHCECERPERCICLNEGCSEGSSLVRKATFYINKSSCRYVLLLLTVIVKFSDRC